VLDDDTPAVLPLVPGGVLNTCYNALDRHVDRRPRPTRPR
jgi:hypothetical protein